MTDEPIVIIGAGAVGRAVAGRLLDSGHSVVIWNRTPDRAAELEQRGARIAATAADAAAAGSLIMLALTDYAAVTSVLDQFADQSDTDPLGGRTIVVLSTGTPEDADRIAGLVRRLGADHLDVGVQAAPQQITDGNALLIYSGPEQTLQRHRSIFELLGPVRWVGAEPSAAAVWDLTLFGLWYDGQLGLLRALDTLRSHGMDGTDFVAAAEVQLGHVVDGAKATAAEVADHDYPAGPATLPEHRDLLRQIIDLRARNRLGDGDLRLPLAVIDRLITAGRGDQGLSAVLDHDHRDGGGKLP